jgi:hypothetical protein
MSKRINAIIEKINCSIGLDQNQTPFLNRYFWNPDRSLIGYDCENLELYNESVLILDIGQGYSEDPYIMEIETDRLEFLVEHFGIYPLHQTNRLSIIENYLENKEYRRLIEILISDYIKPKVILSFSPEISRILSNTFEIELKHQAKDCEMWSGAVLIGSKYFYTYCVQLDKQLDIRSNEVSSFVMASAIYDFQTCCHVNGIKKKNKDFKFPENLLTDEKFRDDIRKLQNINFLQIMSLHGRTAIPDISNAIRDFDEYDLLIVRYLKDFAYGELAINLSMSAYLKLRKSTSAIILCSKYFDQADFDRRFYIQKLALTRLYLYCKYPEDSFNLDWDIELKIIEFSSESYRKSKEAFDRFMV